MDELKALNLLVEQVDELLTDSKHPLDERHARELSLMLQKHTAIALQEIYRQQLSLEKGQVDLLRNLSERRAAIDARVQKVEGDIKDLKDLTKNLPDVEKDVAHLKKTLAEYPTIPWLVRYKFWDTLKVIVGVVVVIVILYFTFKPVLSAWLGVPLP